MHSHGKELAVYAFVGEGCRGGWSACGVLAEDCLPAAGAAFIIMPPPLAASTPSRSSLCLPYCQLHSQQKQARSLTAMLHPICWSPFLEGNAV
eukprot:1150777-Pelagomonas_calceolata.AAC.3